ncbi:MAG TPA: hypothetical protein VKV37_14405 [Ktedonobacteraceae bacterium]|jgi:hypothetical protein|nr:hypothetical protein [Ktedonobacteraceae bacterium]
MDEETTPPGEPRESAALPEYLEQAQKVLAVLNMLLEMSEEIVLDPRNQTAVCNDRLCDACLAWLKLNAIPFVLDDDTLLYRLCREGEWPIR